METLYKKVEPSDRLPDDDTENDTNDGRLLFTGRIWKKKSRTGRYFIHFRRPRWWLEQLPEHNESTLSESKVIEVYVPMHTEPEDDGTFQSLRWGKLRFRKEGWANGNKWKLPSGLAPVDDIIWLKKTTLSVVDHYEEQKQHSHTATDLTEPTVDIAQVGERSPCQPTPLLKNKSNYE